METTWLAVVASTRLVAALATTVYHIPFITLTGQLYPQSAISQFSPTSTLWKKSEFFMLNG
jgi:hypothetical protein